MFDDPAFSVFQVAIKKLSNSIRKTAKTFVLRLRAKREKSIFNTFKPGFDALAVALFQTPVTENLYIQFRSISTGKEYGQIASKFQE